MKVPDKLKSRKFWVAMVGEITSIIVLANGVAAGQEFAMIAGAVIAIAVALGYLKAEKDVDVARATR